MSLIKAMLRTYQGNDLSREKIAAIQKKRLRKLVDHARKNSPYYKKLFEDVGEDFRLSDLPPTTKPQMMSRFDEVVTDRNVTMKKIDDFTRDTSVRLS